MSLLDQARWEGEEQNRPRIPEHDTDSVAQTGSQADRYPAAVSNQELPEGAGDGSLCSVRTR
jgi:hypothetical protein